MRRLSNEYETISFYLFLIVEFNDLMNFWSNKCETQVQSSFLFRWLRSLMLRRRVDYLFSLPSGSVTMKRENEREINRTNWLSDEPNVEREKTDADDNSFALMFFIKAPVRRAKTHWASFISADDDVHSLRSVSSQNKMNSKVLFDVADVPSSATNKMNAIESNRTEVREMFVDCFHSIRTVSVGCRRKMSSAHNFIWLMSLSLRLMGEKVYKQSYFRCIAFFPFFSLNVSKWLSSFLIFRLTFSPLNRTFSLSNVWKTLSRGNPGLIFRFKNPPFGRWTIEFDWFRPHCEMSNFASV